MTPSAFTSRCRKLFGVARWKPLAAAAFGQDWFTIDRYTKGRLSIPARNEWALYGMEMCKKHEAKVWAGLVERWSA